MIYEGKSDLMGAADMYRLALSYNPEYTPARTRLARLAKFFNAVNSRSPRQQE
jgi:hypothetical protein